jgi:branched-chain amino acid transport system permease protein
MNAQTTGTSRSTDREVGPAPSVRSRLAGSASLEVVAVIAGFGLFVAVALDGVLLYLLTTATIYALFALSTNVLFGWTGMASFGQAAYFGTGAYTVGLLREVGLSPLLLVVIGGLAGLVFAGAFGLLAVRTTGVHFAMLTLVFAQVLFLLTYRIDALGGDDGLPGITRGELFGLSIGPQDTFWWFVLTVVAACAFLLRRIQRSTLGLSFNAVRDDPLRAAALGIPARVVPVLAFTIAGTFAGVAGSLFAMQQGLVSSSSLYWVLSGNVIIMCLIGGLRHFWGPALGALVFTVLNWFLFNNVSGPLLYIGLLLLIIVVFLPGGLASIPGLLGHRLRRARRRG